MSSDSDAVGRRSGRQATLLERLEERGDRRTVATGTTGEEISVGAPEFGELTGAEVAVWVAVELNGYQPAEHARATGKAASTARTLLQRAREKMGVEA